MSSIRTFIEALKTGETRTTETLDKVFRRRSGTAADELFAALRHRGAMKAPLDDSLRQVLKTASLPERNIERCIDRWPDDQKEQARRTIVAAIRDGRRVRFRWGLTDARTFETQIDDEGSGPVTITARSPRSSLRIVDGNKVDVAPTGLQRATVRGRTTRRTVPH